MISVIIPVYNCEKYLKECIESLISQNGSDFEVILVDDGSTDNSPRICDEYSARYSHVYTIHKANEGACFARRDAVRVAKGEYICFVDADDIVDKDMISFLRGKVSESRPDIVIYGMINGPLIVRPRCKEGIYEGESLKELKASMIYAKDIDEGIIDVSPCTKLYKKELIQKYLEKASPNLRSWEDISYVYPPIVDSSRVLITHKILYYYRVNEESVSKTYNWDEIDSTLYSLAEAEKIYKTLREDILKSFYTLSLRIIWSFYYRYSIVAMKSGEKDKFFISIDKLRKNDFVVNEMSLVKASELPRRVKRFYNDVSVRNYEYIMLRLVMDMVLDKIMRAPNKMCRLLGIANSDE